MERFKPAQTPFNHCGMPDRSDNFNKVTKAAGGPVAEACGLLRVTGRLPTLVIRKVSCVGLTVTGRIAVIE